MSISDEAVEAASDELVRMRREGSEHSSYEYARAALEAAAPHMLAEAWAEGHQAGYIDGFDGSGVTPNPYRPTNAD